MTPRDEWFAAVLHAGLDTKIFDEQDILHHATPAVLTSSLPRDVMVRVIDATLASGTMSHKAIVDVVSVELLAEKVPSHLIWECIASASDRFGIRDGIPREEGSAREWVRRMLSAGLATGVIAPKDVVEHMTAHVLVQSMPQGITTTLIETSLTQGKMSPELIVEVVGVDAIAQHVATNIVWAMFVKPGESDQAAVIVSKPASTKPRLDILDDEVDNVLVELDADSDAIPAPKPPTVAAGSHPIGAKPPVEEPRKQPTRPPPASTSAGAPTTTNPNPPKN
ncbi:MAG: hypothetical protein ACKV2T_21550 [Kofleriaceae bacterium]